MRSVFYCIARVFPKLGLFFIPMTGICGCWRRQKRVPPFRGGVVTGFTAAVGAAASIVARRVL